MGAAHARRGGTALPAAAGAHAESRTDELNLALARIGFRPYYWYPKGGRTVPPAPPAGVRRHWYTQGADHLTTDGKRRQREIRGAIYVADGEPYREPKDEAELGAMLGYVHAFDGPWGERDTLWVRWSVTVDAQPYGMLWMEALPDTAAAWARLRPRLHEIDAALQKIGLGPSARAVVTVRPRASCGNAY